RRRTRRPHRPPGRRCAHRTPRRRRCRSRRDGPRTDRRHPTRHPPRSVRMTPPNGPAPAGITTPTVDQRPVRATPPRHIPLARIITVELRKSFDTRSGLWLLGSIGIAAVLTTGAVMAWAPKTEFTYGGFTLVPHRSRVLLAKAMGAVVVAAGATLVAFAVGAIGNLVGAAIAGIPTVW